MLKCKHPRYQKGDVFPVRRQHRIWVDIPMVLPTSSHIVMKAMRVMPDISRHCTVLESRRWETDSVGVEQRTEKKPNATEGTKGQKKREEDVEGVFLKHKMHMPGMRKANILCMFPFAPPVSLTS